MSLWSHGSLVAEVPALATPPPLVVSEVGAVAAVRHPLVRWMFYQLLKMAKKWNSNERKPKIQPLGNSPHFVFLKIVSNIFFRSFFIKKPGTCEFKLLPSPPPRTKLRVPPTRTLPCLPPPPVLTGASRVAVRGAPEPVHRVAAEPPLPARGEAVVEAAQTAGPPQGWKVVRARLARARARARAGVSPYIPFPSNPRHCLLHPSHAEQ